MLPFFKKKCCPLIIFKIKFFKIFFEECHQSDIQSARHFIRPDLGPNYLQKYQQTTEVATSKRRVKDDAKLCSYKGKVIKLRTSGKFGHIFANSGNPD